MFLFHIYIYTYLCILTNQCIFICIEKSTTIHNALTGQRVINEKSTLELLGSRFKPWVSKVGHQKFCHPTTTFMLLHMKPNIKII
jgi:hypothetical protein